jgi:hypothetical protein
MTGRSSPTAPGVPHPAAQGSGVLAVMSGSSEGDPEGGQGPGGVAGVVAQGGGEVGRPARLSTPMARLRRP